MFFNFNDQDFSSIKIAKIFITGGLLGKLNDVYRGGAIEVYLVLLANSKDGKKVKISVEQINRQIHFSNWKVVKILKALENAGIILINSSKAGGIKHYVIN